MKRVKERKNVLCGHDRQDLSSKRINALLALILTFCAAFEVQAQTSINIGTVDRNGIGYTFENGVVTITANGEYIITGSSDANRIVVAKGVEATVTLKNVSITSPNSPFRLEDDDETGANVTLLLSGSNTLSADANGYAGLAVEGFSKLTIEGPGSLTATGKGQYSGGGAGIGSNSRNIGAGKGAGTIVINSGLVVATGGADAAGIGGGAGCSGGAISIRGGVVCAKTDGGNNPVAIGSGNGIDHGGAAGDISIRGGVVYAEGNIGAGYAEIEDGDDTPTGSVIIEDGFVVVKGWIGAYNSDGIQTAVSVTGGLILASGAKQIDEDNNYSTPAYDNVLTAGYDISGVFPDITITLTAPLYISENAVLIIPDGWIIDCNGNQIINDGAIVKYGSGAVGDCAADVKIGIEDSLVIIDPVTFFFDDTEKTPNVIVNGLKRDEDYTVTYTDNILVGVATATVTGINRYWGVLKRTFAILPSNQTTVNVKITTTELPPVFLGSKYNQQLKVDDPSESVTWSVSEGSLPKGLTLNASTGIISGTPTQTGLFDFTVTAVTATSSDKRSLQIAVRPKQRQPRVLGEADYMLRPSISSIDFGVEYPYYSEYMRQIITLRNTGTYPLTGLTMSFLAGDASVFTVSYPSGSYAALSEHDITVGLKGGLREGSYSDVLRIYDTYSGYELTIPVQFRVEEVHVILPRKLMLNASNDMATDPLPGIRYIESGKDFVFTVTPSNKDLVPVVTTSRNIPGEINITSNDDGTFTVVIYQISSNITVSVTSKPTADGVIDIASDDIVRYYNGLVHIQIAQPAALSVYTVIGKLYTQQNLSAGHSTVRLPHGLYIIQVGYTIRKILIK